MKIRLKHREIILAVVASVGVVATGIFSAKAVPKSIQLQEKTEKKKGSELTKAEKIKASIPAYILPVVFGTVTITCIMGNSILSERSQASLASAYGLLSTTYTKYRNKVREIYGEEAHQEIMHAIAVDKEHTIWSPGLTRAINTDFEDEGEIRLFYDVFSDRFFESTVEKVMQAEFHINRNYVLGGLYVDLNSWYEFLGLPPYKGGDGLYWISLYDVHFIDFNHYKMPLEDIPVEASDNYLEAYAIEFEYLPMTEKEYEKAFGIF